MIGAIDGIEFEYSADQIREIEKHLPPDRFQRALCLNVSIRPAVRNYLSALKESEMLPERGHLAKRRNEKLAQVEAVLKMIRQPGDLTERFEIADAELMASGEPLLDVLGILIGDFDRMSSVDFEEVIACRVLKRLQQRLESESYEEHVRAENKKDRKHRNELIERLVEIWARAFQKPISSCEISEAETSPLLIFILAVCDPVWVAIKNGVGPKERIGPGQIENIVNDYRRVSMGNETALER
ncbi:hypothetical protein GFL54_24825 [Rhizobium laguerreae]|uniref:hypothetical protein n=1 Tax=Rhizobium laguerreae TaxID=1076926 RepID=UPI00143F587B|nr:hypothetical protein [Rhizobium laguerreae]NKM87464.1 hypothetical protein [Rhizobium laguerreae]